MLTNVAFNPPDNEYERYLTTAYPYYAGAFSTIVATALFAIGFLYAS